MPTLRVELDDLTRVMSDHEGDWVLDTQTGQVLKEDWIRDSGLREDIGLDIGDEDDEFGDALLDSGRFVWIDRIESHESFRWMEEFADRQEGRVRERLLDTLDRPRPFRRFRDALVEFPQVRDAWYEYENQQQEEAARSWLRHSGIDAELVKTTRPPA